MANPSVTYTFTNGTVADATQVNQNFTDLINGLTDGSKSLNVDAITAAGKATFNGAVDLGNATGDVITVNGAFAGTGGDASETQRGLVTTAAQTFAGVKTYNAGVVLGAGNETLSVYDEGTWTPTITSGSGTITTATASGKYIKIGKQITVWITITISNKGTGAGTLNATLPTAFTPAERGCIFGWSGSSGYTYSGSIETGKSISLYRYDGVTPIDNFTYILCGSYYEA